VPRLDAHPEQLEAAQPPQAEPPAEENEPGLVEKLTTDRHRSTSRPWQPGHSTTGSFEKTNSSKSLPHFEQ
jgi:hypothetical protein